ncbi:MAG: helix-turn-helix transcriptional regulator [Akkermansia sp.]|nr:helix-turn-helix transcriptional regulator [Akkermansia sp.]
MQAQNYQLAKISSNLRHLVRRDGRTQRQIAEAAGINPVYVNRWIKGQRMPSDENLQKMAEILGVIITDITEGITETREIPKDKRELEVELFEWRERALVAEAKLAHLQSACAALGQHVSALGLTVKNFSDIISE